MLRFEVSGQVYEIDLSPENMMGDEILLLEDQLPAGYAQRWVASEFGVRDIVVLAYLAAKRGGDQREFSEFVKTIAPLTFRPLEDEKSNADKPRAKARTAPVDGPLGPMVRQQKAKAAKAAG